MLANNSLLLAGVVCDTSHGMGAFIEMFYEYPILFLVIAVGAAGFFIWRRKKLAEVFIAPVKIKWTDY